MTWLKVDDAMHSHAKALRAGNAALGLWLRCGSYAAQHLTDGFVPREIAVLYGPVVQRQKLVAVGLWESVDGGFQMHDFSEYNPTSVQVKADRQASAERQRRARERAQSRRESRRDTEGDTGVSHGVTGDGVTGESQQQSRSPRPDPSRPVTTTTPNGVVDAPRKSKRRTSEASRLDGWLPSPADVEWARAEGLPDEWVREQTARFGDYWRGVPGAKGRKADWPATWRNWLRRDADKIPARSATSATSKAVGWLTIDDQPNLRAIDGGSK